MPSNKMNKDYNIHVTYYLYTHILQWSDTRHLVHTHMQMKASIHTHVRTHNTHTHDVHNVQCISLPQLGVFSIHHQIEILVYHSD